MTTALAFAEELLASSARLHPDLHVIVPTPPESNPRGARAIRIGAIRELERQAALRPAMARRKVFLIDEAERMTGETPQAFLKTLEEPPAATVIILILPRARAVPATLLSRCQVVRFGPRADAGAAAARAQALEILAEVKAQGVDALFRRTDRLEREKAEALVDAYWLYCRDLLLAKSGASSGLLIDADRAAELAREAEGWTVDQIVAAVDVCRQARDALLRNVAPRLTIEIVLSRLALRAA
jgi:DNA polymerase-3 subunit delta'